ncbi:hypothetical protein Ancab_023058 [Ancistrocladus abbreviatus]
MSLNERQKVYSRKYRVKKKSLELIIVGEPRSDMKELDVTPSESIKRMEDMSNSTSYAAEAMDSQIENVNRAQEMLQALLGHISRFSSDTSRVDGWRWGKTGDGTYTVKKAYSVLSKESPIEWLHDRLPTKCNLARRNMIGNAVDMGMYLPMVGLNDGTLERW